ncbi:MAG: Hint domain-containing homing endonuclease, partial [Rickettsiales bacterium]
MTNATIPTIGKITPYPYQWGITEDIKSFIREQFAASKAGKKPEYGYIEAFVSAGKCQGRDTPVLMCDGSIKMIQDVAVGDLLMGHDSKPRKVKSTTSGIDQMYRIDQKRGDSYTVNSAHILSLKVTGRTSPMMVNGERKYPGDIVNVNVEDLLHNLPKSHINDLKGWRPANGVDFNQSPDLPIPPYILGVYLGDGSIRHPSITNVDKEVLSEWYEYASAIGMGIRTTTKDNKCFTHFITGGKGNTKNPLVDNLKDLGIIGGNRHIPKRYLTASRQDRLELLAGILDTDGYLNRGCQFDIAQKSKEFSDQIAFLCRSLGLWCSPVETQKQCVNTGAWGTYYRMSIGGDTTKIPLRVKRRKPTRKPERRVDMTGISITPIGLGDYYGFEIDGPDRLYMMGDFTVTHNTIMLGTIANHCQNVGAKCLIMADQGELVEQNSDECWNMDTKNSIYSASLGRKSTHFPVVVGTSGTIVKSLEKSFKDWVPHIVLIDECHRVNWRDCMSDEPTTNYGRILKWFKHLNPRLVVVGVTGTPFRGTESIKGPFWQHKIGESINREYLVDNGYIVPTVFGFSDTQYDLDGFAPRHEFGTEDFSASELAEMERLMSVDTTAKIMQEVIQVAPTRNMVMITCASERHCKDAARHLPDGSYGIITQSTRKKERKSILDKAKTGEIKYLLQIGCLTTGLNRPLIDTSVILRRIGSLTLLIQLLGRGMRLLKQEHIDAGIHKADHLVLDYSGTMEA